MPGNGRTARGRETRETVRSFRTEEMEVETVKRELSLSGIVAVLSREERK